MHRNVFQKLFEVAPDAILLVDKSGEIKLANQRTLEILGYEQDEIVGEKIEILIPDRIKKSHVGMRDGFFASPNRRPMGVGLDLMAQHKNGEEIPVEISLSPIEVEGEWSAIAIVRDVAEQRALQHRLAASNRDLEQFAYIASHDLQEPLRMVSGYTQLLQRRYSGKLDDDADEFIRYAVNGVKRMQTLISDLLAYSRVSTKAKPHVKTDLQMIYEQVVANLEVAIEESGAKVHCDPLPEIFGDPTQLAQLLQNLIGNAIKFHREGVAPEVTIACADLGEKIEISVKDNGIGIEEQYLDKIFEVFKSLHPREKYQGTGIGLAIVKKIVERHGGTIDVASKIDEGSNFCFTLNKFEEGN